jgi:hypothetical protein
MGVISESNRTARVACGAIATRADVTADGAILMANDGICRELSTPTNDVRRETKNENLDGVRARE